MPGLDKIYEDEHLLALNKPACMHSVRGAGAGSLADLIIKADPKMEKASPKPADGGLVQRLDFETSGVILAAKSKQVWEVLHEALLGGEVQKTYIALVGGQFPKKVSGTVYIGSPYRRAKKVQVSEKPKARFLEAHSEFFLSRYDEKDDASFVTASIGAGRRHQIRAHLAHLGFSLVGDKLYGSKRSLAELACVRQGGSVPPFLLHAQSAALVHPVKKTALKLSAPAPAYLVHSI